MGVSATCGRYTHENRLRIDREIGEKHAIQVILTPGIVLFPLPPL